MTYLLPILKLLHVLTAFWFVAGMIGRDLARTHATKASTIGSLCALIELAAFFDRKMVQPGSIFVLLFGLVLAFLQGWPLLGDFHRGNSNWPFVSLVLYLSILPFIPVFIRNGKRFRQVLDAATAEGRVTEELRKAFHSRIVNIGHMYEYLVVATILVLMITKPF
jgi:uncharacterized membrane protein